MPLDLSVNLGNVLTIVGGLIALAVAWGMLRASITQMNEKIHELRTDRDRHDHRLRNVEQVNSAIGAKLDALFQMVADIREAIRQQRP